MGVVNGLLSSTLGLWRGTQVRAVARHPRDEDLQPLHLYDMEACPFCRLVREALTELDLDVVIYPCPKGGERFRGRVMEMGGKEQFPFLVDPNNDRSLYESWDIIQYLFIHYGDGEVRDIWRLRYFNLLSATAGNLVRLGAGGFAKPSKRPERLLELFSFESSPYCKPVRERLSELEIPYVTRNLGKGYWQDYLLPGVRQRFFPGYQPVTRNRQRLKAETGRVAAPYLVDPNTGRHLFESQKIIRYLNKQYGFSH